jgi:hypothetical protein
MTLGERGEGRKARSRRGVEKRGGAKRRVERDVKSGRQMMRFADQSEFLEERGHWMDESNCTDRLPRSRSLSCPSSSRRSFLFPTRVQSRLSCSSSHLFRLSLDARHIIRTRGAWSSLSPAILPPSPTRPYLDRIHIALMALGLKASQQTYEFLD